MHVGSRLPAARRTVELILVDKVNNTGRTLILPAQRAQLTLNGLQRLRYPERLQLVPVVRLIIPGQGRHWLIAEKQPASRDLFWGLDVDDRRVEFGPVSLEMLSLFRGAAGQPLARDDTFAPREPLSCFLELLRGE